MRRIGTLFTFSKEMYRTSEESTVPSHGLDISRQLEALDYTACIIK